MRVSAILTLACGACALRGPARRAALGRSVTMNANSVEGVTWDKVDGSNVRIGIIRTRWNPLIVNSLADGARAELEESGVKKENIFETKVPGAWELPSAARFLAMSGTVDAIICVGCLVKGDTMHFEYIAQTVATGLMSVQLQTSVPCTFGVLTVLTEEQAAKRSYDGENHGISWGKTAVEMAVLRQEALGMAKGKGNKGTITLGFSDADALDKEKGSGKPEKKIFF